MGAARLLAKGWIVFCLFAGVHALRFALLDGEGAFEILSEVIAPVLLFLAMGVVFVVGYGASGMHLNPFLARLKPHLVIPGFNELVFMAFVLLSLVNQMFVAPAWMGSHVAGAISAAVAAVVPGQRALEDQLSCGLDGGRVFSSAFAWILALIYVGSGASRIKLLAGLLRIERVTR